MPNSAPLRSCPAVPATAARAGHEVEGELPFEGHHGVGHRVQARLLELQEVPWRGAARLRHRLRPRAQDLGGEHVAQRRLVQRLDRVGEEQAVAPGDEVVQVLHHHVPLVGARPGPRHDVRLEGVGEDGVVPRDDVCFLGDERGVAELAVRSAQQGDQLGDIRYRAVLEYVRLPVLAIRAERVEDPFKPLLRFGEPLVIAQVDRYRHRGEIRELPGVQAVRAAQRRVQRSRREDPSRCWERRVFVGVLPGEAAEEAGGEHVVERRLVQLLDQVADERVAERLEAEREGGRGSRGAGVGDDELAVRGIVKGAIPRYLVHGYWPFPLLMLPVREITRPW